MKIPRHLAHEPVVVLEDYDKIDGSNVNNSDAKGLSLGFAQYNKRDISAKVWRYSESGKKWSRQSEELPLNRVLDLALLILKTKLLLNGNFKESTLSQNDISLNIDFEGLKKVEEFKTIFKNYDSKYLNERIEDLKKVINQL
ncbi:DUF6530 family protein [Fusobacterium ulcerans]|uniref:DUF6530 family protein n=1 Tax=Fusobacterium ulcerans TaxID=861 RepID=UPI0034B851AA